MPPRKQARNASAHKKRNRHRSKSQSADPYVTGKGKDGSCPIVGIGGSSRRFLTAVEVFRQFSATNGIAVVIGPPPYSHSRSPPAPLLRQNTSMPVNEIAE